MPNHLQRNDTPALFMATVNRKIRLFGRGESTDNKQTNMKHAVVWEDLLEIATFQ